VPELCRRQTHSNSLQPTQTKIEGNFDCLSGHSKTWQTLPSVGVAVVDQFPVRALSVQVGERAADKIVFSMAELTGDIWMMKNISEKKRYHRP